MLSACKISYSARPVRERILSIKVLTEIEVQRRVCMCHFMANVMK